MNRDTVMINIAILDDNENDRLFVKKIVDEYCETREEECNVYTYESSMDLLFDLDQGRYFNLFFLDVELPVHSGLEVAREIRKYYLEPVIVYITDYVEYSIEAYEVNAFRYIPKRLLRVKLIEALEHIIPKLAAVKQSTYVITHYLDMEILYHDEIFYLKKEGKYVVITHKRGESRVRKALQEVLEELSSNCFLEIGKGCAVNIRHVMSIEHREIVLRNGIRIPVSYRRLDEIKERIMDYWAGKM